MSPPPAAPPPSPTVEQTRWFAEQAQPHQSQLKAYLRNAFPSVREVDEVVQESYLHLWKRQLQAPIRSAKSFLFRIARNLAIDSVRHKNRSPFDAVADPQHLSVLDSGPNAADAACTNEELDLLLEAIDALPARCREIIILRKLHGLSQKEIAARMGIAERTVEVQGTKGLDRLEAFLRKRGVTGRTRS